MLTLACDRDLMPFPALAPTLLSQFGVGELGLRPFGRSPADTEIDFQCTSRPELETALVTACTQAAKGTLPSPEFFWHLDVGVRTECLLTLGTWGGTWDLEVELNCREPSCQSELDLTFSLAELSQLQHPVDRQDPIQILLGGQSFTLRRPTGLDQLHWRSQPFPDEASPILALIQSLLPPEQRPAFQQSWELEADPLACLNLVMAQQDPLVSLNLTVGCPVCGALDVHIIDLGAHALQRLRAAQDRLLATVHRLASHYHWTEAEIFALPAWRRDRYLALIERSQP
jgi:hypothetical protein